MEIFKSLETPNIWKQTFIPLAIFVHKFDCWCGWTGLYHALCLGSSIFTLLYYCQSDKTGLITVIASAAKQSQPLRLLHFASLHSQ
ncbi:hypothetical protein FDUTEX481_05955 [Tolypothrix sp. PCC 7601]|nr:hypothetical protein FDUTEX481_05955 [Tolypothrix sp. PCC 7601]